MSNQIDLYRQTNSLKQKWVNLLRQSHLHIEGTNYLEGGIGLSLPRYISEDYNSKVINTLLKYPNTGRPLSEPIKNYMALKGVNTKDIHIQTTAGGLSSALVLNYSLEHQNLGSRHILLAGGPYHFTPTAGMAISTRPGSSFTVTAEGGTEGFKTAITALEHAGTPPNSLLLNIPNNPTGHVEADLFRDVLHYCETYHISLTIDACYDDFIFDPIQKSEYEEVLAKAMAQQNCTVSYAKSFSKLLAPDPRAGFIVTNNEELAAQFTNQITFDQAGVTRPAQVALGIALKYGPLLTEIKMTTIQENKALLDQSLGYESRLDGGYYLCLPTTKYFFDTADRLELAFHPAKDFLPPHAIGISDQIDYAFARIPLLTGTEHMKRMIDGIESCL
jgi:aspartate/methionine/tyrosine aminotransferase